MRGDAKQTVERGRLQRGLQQQVAAGVAAKAKLGKDEDAHARVRGAVDEPDDILRIFGAVRDVNARNGGAHAEHST